MVMLLVHFHVGSWKSLGLKASPGSQNPRGCLRWRDFTWTIGSQAGFAAWWLVLLAPSSFKQPAADLGTCEQELPRLMVLTELYQEESFVQLKP